MIVLVDFVGIVPSLSIWLLKYKSSPNRDYHTLKQCARAHAICVCKECIEWVSFPVCAHKTYEAHEPNASNLCKSEPVPHSVSYVRMFWWSKFSDISRHNPCSIFNNQRTRYVMKWTKRGIAVKSTWSQFCIMWIIYKCQRREATHYSVMMILWCQEYMFHQPSPWNSKLSMYATIVLGIM